MRLLNADGSWSKSPGTACGLAALLLRDDTREDPAITITTAGASDLVRTGRERSRRTFRAAMGLPADLAR
jgi:hypothetical protein